jgi:plastocyanin
MFAASFAVLSLVSAATAAVHEVTVGGDAPNQIKYQPEALAASIGDTVRFTFKQKNHTVTQTSFANVCNPLLDQYTGQPVLDSGFKPVGPNETYFPTWDYEVKTLDPVWVYCRQTNHCGQGMVFAINCPTEGDNSFDNFKKAALAFGASQSSQAPPQPSSQAPPEYSQAPPAYSQPAPSYGADHDSWAATATSDVYGGHTYAPVWHPTVTDTVTQDGKTWTTTYESYPNSPAPTPVDSKGVEHRVLVGEGGGLTYNPSSIRASPHDTVIFEFKAKNHTVTQSSFGDPCRKLEFTSTTGEKGFDSGFMPVNAASPTDFPTFSITVNDTAPIWVYCRQGNHCGQGMVFAINSDESSDRNFAAFQALAKTINGTGSNSNSTGQTANSQNAAPAVRASMASAALLAVGGFFALAL